MRIVLALEGGGGGIGVDGGADKCIAFFFDGVLLSQKTHGLLLASASHPNSFTWIKTAGTSLDSRTISSASMSETGRSSV